MLVFGRVHKGSGQPKNLDADDATRPQKIDIQTDLSNEKQTLR